MRLVSVVILLAALLCAGCAAGKSYDSYNMNAGSPDKIIPDSIFAYDDDYYGDDEDYDGGGDGKVGKETMLMAHGGARRVERRHWNENKWPEFGVEGVHVLSEQGMAVDWALLGLRITGREKEYDMALDTITKTTEETRGSELQLGFRYLFDAGDGVWPFVRGWGCYQYGSYDAEVKDLNTGIKGKIKGDGDGVGGGAGAGVVFALGEYRLQLAAGYSWVRTRLDLVTTIGPITVDRQSPRASVGGEPSIWLAFGKGF